MVWVIGNRGMLGSEICRQLDEREVVYCCSDIDVDITDIGALRHFAEGLEIDYIVNCAAYTAVDKAESDVELAKRLNEEAPGNIAQIANEIGATLIHISTDYVFDGSGNAPLTEDMAVCPIGVYGVTKAAGEKAVMEKAQKYYILRTAWLYGWAGKNFVYTMIRAMNSHESVKVVNDQRGTPTFAFDLAGVILALTDKGDVPYGVYHVTDLGDITWWDFTNEIKKQAIEAGLMNEMGRSCVVNPCTTEEYPTPAKRPAYSVLSKEKIQKALGITLPDWKESLSKFINAEFFDRERIK